MGFLGGLVLSTASRPFDEEPVHSWGPSEDTFNIRAMEPSRRGAGLVGAAAYVVLAALPLLVMLCPPVPAGRIFWVELAIALGFVGLGQVAVEFGLIGRYATINRPYGIDLLMHLHRIVGMLALTILVAHPVILVLARPAYRQAIDPVSGTMANRLGWLSLAALVLIVVITLGRRRLRLGYEAWRLGHLLLAAAALGLGLAHALGAGRYLGAPWKAVALGIYCALALGLAIHLRLIRPALLRRRPYRLVAVRPDAAETWSVAVEPLGHPGLRFAAGQFAWVRFGVSPWSLREHPFSFSSSAEHPGRFEFGIKELGDFTRTIGSLPPGTPIWVDGPHGSFSSDFVPAQSFLFIAGGIGISPILSMLRTLADRGDRRPHALVYACSRWDRVAFRADIEALAESLELEVIHVLEEGHEGWQGAVGYIDDQVLAPRIASPDGRPRTALACGPPPMLAAVEASLIRCGMAGDRIHMERFHLA